MISRTLTRHGVNPSSAFLNIYTGCVGFLSTEGLMSVVTVFGLFQQSWWLTDAQEATAIVCHPEFILRDTSQSPEQSAVAVFKVEFTDVVFDQNILAEVVFTCDCSIVHQFPALGSILVFLSARKCEDSLPDCGGKIFVFVM